MSAAGMLRGSWRWEQGEPSRLAWALLISMVLHLSIFGTYEAGRKLGWWRNAHWPSWMHSVKMLTELLKKKESPPPPQMQEVPLVFVDVNPAQATTEAPKDAKYYSARNSVAANPEEAKDSDTPKITGTQKEIPKTEDVPRQKFVPLQPSAPPTPPQPAKTAQEQSKPKAAQPPGDLAMAKPQDTPQKDDGQAEHTRPRTIAEALARQPNSARPPAEKMKQDGGARRAKLTSLDAKATPFGAYDEMLEDAISQAWFSMLDQRDYSSDGRGRVVVDFTLQYDGRITDLTVPENTAGEVLGIICRKAVLDPSPYEPWPSEMRRALGDTRHIQFTFYYN